MRIICEIYPVEIADIETWRLEQLCAERAGNIEELRTLVAAFRLRAATREEHSPLFRDNLASIVRGIEDLEVSCTLFQHEIEAMKAELKKRRGGGGGNIVFPARVASHITWDNFTVPV